MRFWDSSAIVSLVVAQPGSREAERWIAEDARPAIWTLTPVEVASALQRLGREGALKDTEVREAEVVADEVGRRAHVIADIERVKALATRLLRVHALRAADALQLGAALAWADGDPRGMALHTLDRRLATAAEREGFRVPAIPPAV